MSSNLTFATEDIQKAKDYLSSLDNAGEDILITKGSVNYKLTALGKEFFNLSGLLMKNVVEIDEFWEVV